MAAVQLTKVTKSFGKVEVIKGVDLSVESGEFVVFVGPSGCGKSTLLRMISGLEEVTSGTIHIDDNDVTHVDAADRGVAMVFQTYALYPHMTVQENMGFGLKMNGVPKAEVKQRVDKAAAILELGDMLDRKPKQLSGGQRQRVAIGRAIVRDPKVFLFDEPLSNLDAELRVAMRIEIAKLHGELDATMIYVTHDQVEAMTLADKIVVLRGGYIEQVGAPLALYDNPDNLFVAGFIGSPSMNFFAAEVVSSDADKARVRLSGHNNLEFDLPVTSQPAAGTGYKLGIRPEHFEEGAAVNVSLHVDVAEHLGGTSFIYARTAGGETAVLEAREGRAAKKNSEILTAFDPGRAFLFDGGDLRVR
ncbi:MAG: Glycerol-3-phosphate ABC transporter, ATP-binding protein UgpC (TC 3.A.1.1.3) [uncultured Thiotrichaceae bacterium]|uniref:Glycerol-3-phosphate ABC transporter, ATP-binding protein UgpC (TC 3.A.1.1.3) n=1 Tax=uncultured Thiotrichaceae bacterium TaxID=298394 RepID=A0A6S6UAH0_9GAMM|nr:MAG: Glycerol-3-phosphate ABC transporter, ATP-binding protein UgpC (TC 3.A.1.1.3) [uncultured Thiotrichaceae bacterium]